MNRRNFFQACIGAVLGLLGFQQAKPIMRCYVELDPGVMRQFVEYREGLRRYIALVHPRTSWTGPPVIWETKK